MTDEDDGLKDGTSDKIKNHSPHNKLPSNAH